MEKSELDLLTCKIEDIYATIPEWSKDADYSKELKVLKDYYTDLGKKNRLLALEVKMETRFVEDSIVCLQNDYELARNRENCVWDPDMNAYLYFAKDERFSQDFPEASKELHVANEMIRADTLLKNYKNDLKNVKNNVDGLSAIASVMTPIFQNSCSFTSVDEGKMMHALPLPNDLIKAEITSPTEPIVVPNWTIGYQDANIRFNTSTKISLFNFYSNIIGVHSEGDEAKDFDTAMQATTDYKAVTYDIMYRAARYVAVLKSWFSVNMFPETVLSKSPLPTADYNDAAAKMGSDAWKKAIRLANCFHVLKALSWWQTNHNTGVKSFSNIWKKGLALIGVIASAADATNLTLLYPAMYNIIHFSSPRNILYSIMPFSMSYVIAEGMVTPPRVTLDFFATLRTMSYPAGMAYMSFLTAVLPQIVASHTVYLMSAYADLDKFFLALEQYKAHPHHFHVGADYLTIGEKVLKVTISPQSLEDLAASCAAYVDVHMSKSSIKNSFYLAKILSKGIDTAYLNHLKTLKDAKKEMNDLQSILSSVSVGLIASELRALPSGDKPEEKKARADGIKKLEAKIINEDIAMRRKMDKLIGANSVVPEISNEGDM